MDRAPRRRDQPDLDVLDQVQGRGPEGRREDVEGIGEIEAFVFHGAPFEEIIASKQEPYHPPTRIER